MSGLVKYFTLIHYPSQCCGSGMFIPDPGSWFLPIPDPGSRIPDPKTATKERGEKKFVVNPFFVATNFIKLKIILLFKCWRKKLGPVFKELLNFLPKNLSLSSKKYGVGIRDPGSVKTLFRIPDPGPGVKMAPDPGSRFRIRNTSSFRSVCSVSTNQCSYRCHSNANPDLLILMQNQGPNPLP